MQRISVYGVEGTGKTAVMMQIHPYQILETAAFDNVYWINVSDEFSIHKLQSDISEVGCDPLYEKDARKRASMLHKRLLRRKKCALILDRVLSYFDEDEVGIPTQENGYRLVLTVSNTEVVSKDGLP
ncbi:hypothetical protein M5689_013576 [Euphorbia peplus]|nr:hypothetical protein M5689_013576 [Euphorbia peplus]